MARYQRKRKRVKESVEYGSPRYYQAEAAGKRNPNRLHPKRKQDKHYCKRLKGPHDWSEPERHRFQFHIQGDPTPREWIWENFYCKACGKKMSRDIKKEAI